MAVAHFRSHLLSTATNLSSNVKFILFLRWITNYKATGRDKAVVQVVEALRCKPEGRGFDFDWIFGIFNLLTLSGRTMTLASTLPLTEINTKDISWG